MDLPAWMRDGDERAQPRPPALRNDGRAAGALAVARSICDLCVATGGVRAGWLRHTEELSSFLKTRIW